MKQSIALFIVLLITASSSHANPVRLMESTSFEDMSLTFWEAPEAQIQKWPRWDTSKEPPLKPSLAVSRALESLPPGENRSQWALDSLSIRQATTVESRSASSPVFFYFITLSRKGNTSTVLDFLVTFDGTVLQPKKEKLPVGSHSTFRWNDDYNHP